ncbi:MAG: SRPBCC family protein [Thermodesulfobacteriota bacterium]
MSHKKSKKPDKSKKSEFVYVTYIEVKPQQLWNALTSRRFTPKYFFGRKVESSWEVGSPITFWTPEGEKDVYGEILAFEPGRLLAYTFKHPLDQAKRKKPSQVRLELTPMGSFVKLKLIHKDLMAEDFEQDSDTFRGVNNGWPAILSALKTLLETGESLNLPV